MSKVPRDQRMGTDKCHRYITNTQQHIINKEAQKHKYGQIKNKCESADSISKFKFLFLSIIMKHYRTPCLRETSKIIVNSILSQKYDLSQYHHDHKCMQRKAGSTVFMFFLDNCPGVGMAQTETCCANLIFRENELKSKMVCWYCMVF